MIKWIKNKISDYARSPQWPDVRRQHIQTEPFCRACNRKKNLEVHHIVPYHIKPEEELNPSNLITLCTDCHLLFGHLMDYKSWNETVIEDCNIFSSKIRNRPYNEKHINNTDSFFECFRW